MSSSWLLTDKESLENYRDYKDEIGYELSRIEMKHTNAQDLELDVIKELHIRNLVNYDFYMKQCETIKMNYQYHKHNTIVGCLECCLLIGSFSIIIVILIYTSPLYNDSFISHTLDKFDI